MTYLADLNTIRDNLTAELVTISADPQTTYSAGGRSWSHDEHLANITKRLDDLDKLIARASAQASGPISTRVLG